MDDGLRASVEEWAEYLGPEFADSLPRHADVRAALRAGDWSRVDALVDGAPFGGTADGLALRALIADVRQDRATLREVGDRLSFEERPAVKLWCLRLSGRAREAAALLRAAPTRFRDEEVLREGLASAWIEDDWTLYVALAAALAEVAEFTGEEWTAYGWALERRGRLQDAVDAYVRAYGMAPEPWISRRLVRIVLDTDDERIERAIDAFAAEERAERSDDDSMRLLAFMELWNRGRRGRALGLAFRIAGRAFARMFRGLARIGLRKCAGVNGRRAAGDRE